MSILDQYKRNNIVLHKYTNADKGNDKNTSSDNQDTDRGKPQPDEYRKNVMPDLTSMLGDKKKVKDVQKEPGTIVNTNRLNTPKLRRMALINDGSQALKDEINESYLRVKAAKHGMRLSDVIPDHGLKFYLPNKHNYIKPKEYQKVPDYRDASFTRYDDKEEGLSNTFIVCYLNI
jgi:hypothetical protein